MSRPAHPEAMRSQRTGRTRTAPPQLPGRWPWAPRYLSYLLFDATGLVYLLVGFCVLRVAWALGDASGESWRAVMEDFRHPLYVAFHGVTLAAVLFVGVRFFGLFPKAQPPRIGPVKPPPRPVLQALLYGTWLGVTGILVVILGGFLR